MTDAWIKAWVYLALAVVALLGAWMFKSEAEADHKPEPPPERPPSDNEVKTALSDLRSALERLQSSLERQHDHQSEELRDIKRSLDRIENARRLEDALGAIYRQQKET